jgi:hypothetical protein
VNAMVKLERLVLGDHAQGSQRIQTASCLRDEESAHYYRIIGTRDDITKVTSLNDSRRVVEDCRRRTRPDQFELFKWVSSHVS